MEADATRFRALVDSGLFWPGRDPKKPIIPAQGARQRWSAESLVESVDAYIARSGTPRIATPKKST
jgi:hypothetical protein